MSDGQSEVCEQQEQDANIAERNHRDRAWWDRHAQHYRDEARSCILKATAIEAEILKRFGPSASTR